MRISPIWNLGLPRFDERMPGFISDDALLHGVETRTSSPVTIARDPASLQVDAIQGLYPCGEGAGHAGGIMSAAVDGIRVANAIIDQIGVAAASHGESPVQAVGPAWSEVSSSVPDNYW